MPREPTPWTKLVFFGGVAAVFLVVLVLFNFLRFPIRGDELHFWPTSLMLFQRGFPSVEQLRTYNELNTPLPFLVFGGLEYIFHSGIVLGRAINLASSLAIVLLIGAAGDFSLRSILCVVGLLVFPYFLLVGAHLYTDTLAVLFTIGGIALYLRRWYWTAALSFIMGIACRQYIVAFPVALIAHKLVSQLRSGRIVIDAELVSPAIAALSLAGWYLFFGAAAPEPALQAQDVAVGGFYPQHGLYFLTCIGAYFVLPECVLFRSAKRLLRPGPASILIAGAISALFWLSPPIENTTIIVPTMGYFDIAVRSVLPVPARLTLFWVLAVIACLRFRPLSLGGLMLYANAAMMAGAHLAWDKYALPMLAALWLLESADQLDELKPTTASPPAWGVNLGQS
jgi:hypothetical protein